MESSVEKKLSELNLDYDSDDVKKLTDRLAYLSSNNLEKLKSRLLDQNKPAKFLQTLTEVNFSFELLSSLPQKKSDFKIEYEPDGKVRPVDFVIQCNAITYNVQIKYLSSSVRVNKQNKIEDEIKRQSKLIQANRGLLLRISQDFKMDNVNNLMGFIRANLVMNDGEELLFTDSDGVTANIVLQTPENGVRENLVLYGFAVIGAQEVTGETKVQVKGALLNALGAFDKECTPKEVNLIVSEITSVRRESIDFADALYGTEYSTFSNGSAHTHRDNDGLFQHEEFAKKVAAIIVVHRKNPTLISDYERVICSNPAFDHINVITNLIHDKIIERFTWIDGGFFKT